MTSPCPFMDIYSVFITRWPVSTFLRFWLLFSIWRHFHAAYGGPVCRHRVKLVFPDEQHQTHSSDAPLTSRLERGAPLVVGSCNCFSVTILCTRSSWLNALSGMWPKYTLYICEYAGDQCWGRAMSGFYSQDYACWVFVMEQSLNSCRSWNTSCVQGSELSVSVW